MPTAWRTSSGLTARNDQGTAVTNVVAAHLDATQAVAENNATVVEDSSFTGTTSLLGVHLAAEKRGVASGTSVSVSGATVSGYGLIEAVSVYSQDTVEVNNSTLLLSDVSMDGEPALIAGVDRVLDMIRTSINVVGDSTTALAVSRMEGELGTEPFEEEAA